MRQRFVKTNEVLKCSLCRAGLGVSNKARIWQIISNCKKLLRTHYPTYILLNCLTLQGEGIFDPSESRESIVHHSGTFQNTRISTTHFGTPSKWCHCRSQIRTVCVRCVVITELLKWNIRPSVASNFVTFILSFVKIGLMV